MFLFIISACTSAREVVEEKNFHESDTGAEEIVARTPDYSASLSSLRGKGRAIVSEPGNTERVTVYFSSNRKKSLVTVKNALGIEGGQLLTDGDSLLVYNKIDKFARKVSIREGNLSSIDHLASLNILTLINFTTESKYIRDVLENEDYYLLILKSDARMFIDKETFTTRQVWQPRSSTLPYSKIIYEAYSEIDGFRLPRRITIFSADAKSKVVLLIQSLEVNPELGEITVELPDNITIYSR